MVAAETDSEAEFVERLVRDAMGGFDIPAAAARLKWTSGPKRPQKLERELARAEKDVREASKKQRELAGEEADLAKLEVAIRETEAAESELHVVRLAIDLRAHEEALEHLDAKLARFPDAVRTLNGTESEELARIRADMEDLELQKAKLEQAQTRARQAMKQARFGDEPPSDAQLDSWKEWARTLADLERSISDEGRNATKARGVLEKAWSAVSDAALDPDGSPPEREHARAWNELWKDWAEFSVRSAALDAQRSMLERMLESDHGPGPDVDHAHRLLARWLRSGSGSLPSRPFLAALSVLVVVFLSLAWVVSPVFGLGLLIPAALFLWNRKGADATTSRTDVESEWRLESLPVDAPDWSEESVRALYDRLGEMKATRAVADAARARLDALEDQARPLEAEGERISERARQLEAASGLRVHDRMQDAAWLGLMVQRMLLVDTAREDLARAEGLLASLQAERNALLARLNDRMRPVLDHPVDDAVVAVADVAERASLWRAEHDKLVSASDDLEDRVRPALAKKQSEESALLARLGLSSETAWKLDGLMEQFGEYRQVEKERVKRESLVAEAKARLTSATNTSEDHGERASWTIAELKNRESELEQIVARAQALRDKRTRIRTNIDSAGQQLEMTNALETRDRLLNEIDAHWHDARRQLAGQVVVEHIRTEAMKRSMPAVFTRAQELLARFTAGALQLEVDLTGDAPRMVAKSDSGVPRSMGHLSVGERVQVLMAVRVAFLEHEEPLTLPLLVDEALGTTDDDRARTIIDTLLQLAADGRQVFYFTAQSDELGKWRERIAQHGGFSDRDWAWIELADVRKMESSRRTPLPEPRDPSGRDIPAPDNRSHADYLRALEVPGLRPLAREPGQEHIGHVVEDTDLLHALLLANVTTVHAWKTLDRWGSPLTGPERDHPAVRARIALLEDAVDLWRTGRGRPVDRSVLEASGAVSATHMESAADLARRVDGEASRILSGLEAGEVSRFHKAKITELRDWLLDHDYLDPADPMAADAARIQLLSRHQEVPPETIDRIVNLLWTTD
jgi:hypothetical protein